MNSNDIDKHDYRIESLGATFAKHAEKSEENDKIIIEKFKIECPGCELPEHMINPFNVARALSVMACEIEKLKTSIGN